MNDPITLRPKESLRLLIKLNNGDYHFAIYRNGFYTRGAKQYEPEIVDGWIYDNELDKLFNTTFNTSNRLDELESKMDILLPNF